MKAILFAAGLLCAAATSAAAEDNQAGTPLAPGDAAGAWTLETGGHDLCVVTLSAARSGPGYGVKVPASCGADLPGSVTAWAPSGDGMKFRGADGRTVVAFGRWSNSLFVSHRASDVDVHLRRGGAAG